MKERKPISNLIPVQFITVMNHSTDITGVLEIVSRSIKDDSYFIEYIFTAVSDHIISNVINDMDNKSKFELLMDLINCVDAEYVESMRNIMHTSPVSNTAISMIIQVVEIELIAPIEIQRHKFITDIINLFNKYSLYDSYKKANMYSHI